MIKAGTKALPAQDRNFFITINKLMASNPYCEERREAERCLFGESIVQDEIAFHDAYCRALNYKLTQLNINETNLLEYDPSDARLIGNSIALKLYLDYSLKFDELLLKQMRQPQHTIKAPFVIDLIAQLTSLGLNLEKATELVGLFYQYRRAHYFICQDLIGTSQCMRELRKHLWFAVFTRDGFRYITSLLGKLESFSTLIVGETGSGKGVAAAAIGRSGYIPFDMKSCSFREPYTECHIPLNLSQFPESLIESELFGHRKGAFTGALHDRKGVLERSNRWSAVFLDEIGELPLPIQVKLLQVLQERRFFSIGGESPIAFEGRIICATNQDLEKMRNEGTFRDDLYYRICSDIIRVPTLQVRLQEDPNELTLLLCNIVTNVTGKLSERIVEEVQNVIENDLPSDYHWPGNFRELEQCVRRVLMTGRYKGEISFANKYHDASVKDQFFSELTANSVKAKDLLIQYSRYTYSRFGSMKKVSDILGLDRRTVKKFLSDDKSWHESSLNSFES